MYNKMFRALGALVVIISQLQAGEAAKCSAALKKAIRDNPESVTIDRTACPLSNRVLIWLQLQKNGSFLQAKSFMEKHPTWPRLSLIQRQAEKDLCDHPIPAAQAISWFRKYPPISLKGMKAFGNALLSMGQKDDHKFRDSFQEIEFLPSELSDVVREYRALLTEDVLAQKAHAYLNKKQNLPAEILVAYVSGEGKKLLQNRLAIFKTGRAVSSDFTTHPAIRFELARLYRKDRNDRQASHLLSELDDFSDQEAVWPERNLIARRLIEAKQYELAYQTVKNHGLSRGESFANAEWLAGWLSLRFLNNPDQAREHFEKLHDNVSTPMSLARAQYWLGRAHDMNGDKTQAQSWWTKAKQHMATYYGQLAHKELHGKIPAIKPKLVVADLSVRKALESRDLYKYIRLLLDTGETSMAEVFVLQLGGQLKDPNEQALLTQVMFDKGQKYQGLKVYKKIMKTDYPVIQAAYPRISVPSKTVEPAFIHAIIRQESRFQHDVVSSAGATGLMQLMPATAARTEKKHKIKKKQLTNPDHNVKVGSHHLKDLMQQFSGSMVLSAAAYNAGDKPVNEWIEQFGDPRKTDVDLVDWVELIPYAETRNYVQRVMENYHCYR